MQLHWNLRTVASGIFQDLVETDAIGIQSIPGTEPQLALGGFVETPALTAVGLSTGTIQRWVLKIG